MPQQKLDIQPLDIQPLNVEPPKRGEATLSDVVTGNLPQAEPSFLSSVYHALSDPLTDLPSRAARTVSGWMDKVPTVFEPTGQGGLNDYLAGVDARAKGFFQGATEGVGDLLSSLTSPANIAMTALTGGSSLAARQGLPQIARLASMGAKATAVPGVIHGGSAVLSPESSLQERGQGLVELAGNIAGASQKPKVRGVETLPEGPLDTPVTTPETVPAVRPAALDIQPITAPTNAGIPKFGQKGPKVPEGVDPATGEIIDGSHPNDPFILDSARMQEEAAARERSYDPAREDANAQWERTQRNMAAYEGRFNPPNTMANTLGDTSNYTPAQLAVKASWDRMQAFKDKYSQWFAEQENALPEGQYFEPPPEVKAKYDAELAHLTALHEANVAKLPPDTIQTGPIRPETIDVTPTSVEPVPPKPTMGNAPMGQRIIIRKEGATPEVVKRAKEAGFEFEGLNDQGNFRFRKVREPGGAQPILESEVGQARPTTAGVKEHLGPVTDVKRSNPIVEAFNLPRGLMAAVDFSAPLRQGLGLIHKGAFWKSLGPMFKSWASEEGFRAHQNSIAERPLFRERPNPKNAEKPLPSFADDAGLKLTDLTDLSKREEAIMSTWAEKVPGVRRSNRAYTAFLNNLRADAFESLVRDSKVFGADAKANLPLARELAKFVNTATGRGSLGSLEQSAVALNTALFSPRLIASRIGMMTKGAGALFSPETYIFSKPSVRREYLKSLFAIAAVGNTVTQLGRMAGGEVSGDPTNSDFGKLKIGNTRVDPYGGFQQYIVLASRLLSGKVTSSTSGNEYDIYNPEGPYDPSAGEVLMRFGRGKLHPVLGFAYSLLSGGKEMSGEKMDFSTMNPMENAVAQRFIPILLQDLYELSQNDELPPELKALIGTMSAFGMGSQTYEGPGQK